MKIKAFFKDLIALCLWALAFIKNFLLSRLKEVRSGIRSKEYSEKLNKLHQLIFSGVESALPQEPKKFWVSYGQKLLKFFYIVLLLLFTLNVAKCMYKPSKIAIHPVVEGQMVRFEGSTKPLNGIKSVDLTVGSTEVLSLPGRLVWDEDKTAKVYSPFTGRVHSVEVQLGQKIEKGQTLAVIQSPDFGSAQADARKAQAAASLAKSNLNRAKELFEHGIIAKKDLEQVSSDAAQAIAEDERASSRIKALGANVKTVDQRFPLNTPVGGIVVERNIYPGREIGSDLSNAPLITITDPSNLWAILEASEVDVGRFDVGAEVVLRNNALPDEKLVGKITQISNFVDPVTRTIKVRVEVPNQNLKLKAEMFVQAEIPLTHIDGIVVPAKAVFLVGTHHFVFVELEQNKFMRRGVHVGARFSDKVEIIEGLKPEDRVVTEGNLYLHEILRTNSRGGIADETLTQSAKPLIESYPLDVNAPSN